MTLAQRTKRGRRGGPCRAAALWLAAALALAPAATRGHDAPEYRLKAAFVYNFMVYTEWPADIGPALNLCIHGADPFGAEIDALNGAIAGGRSIAVQRKAAGDSLRACQAVFIAASAIDALPQLLERLRGQAVLTMADSAGATRRGVTLNMTVVGGKVTFEANLQAARRAGLGLSSKLLRLATEVHQ